MAAEVQLKIVADAEQAQGATKSLKSQLRDAVREAQELSSKFGETSSEALNAQKKVAALREEISDINQRINALNPEAKFTAIGDLAQGIAGGFAAAQGAMALFGTESQNVEKALLKVQSAMAISEGLNSIRGLGDAFGNVKLVVGDAIKSLFTLRGALIATGIGAFAAVVAAVASNWDKVKKAIDDSFPSLGGVANLFDNLKKVAMGSLNSIVEGFKVVGEVLGNIFTGEFSAAVDTAKTFGSRVSQAYTEGFKKEEETQQREREAKILEGQIKAHQRQIKLMEAQGKETYTEKKKALEEELRLIELQNGKETDAYKDKYLELQVLQIEHYKQLEKNRKEEEAKAKEFENRRINSVLNYYAGVRAAEDQAEKERQADQDIRWQETLDRENEQTSKEWAAFTKSRAEKSAADAQALKDQKLIEDAKYSIAADSLNAITALGNLFIKNDAKLRKFQKAAAVTQIAIDTAKAISTTIANATQAASAGGPAAPFLAAAYIASGIAQVLGSMLKAKQALSAAGGGDNITLPSAPAGGGGGGFGNTGTPQAPVNAFAPQGARTTITNQEGQGANALGQIQVFVTEGDISTTQQRVGSIRKKATVVQ